MRYSPHCSGIAAPWRALCPHRAGRGRTSHLPAAQRTLARARRALFGYALLGQRSIQQSHRPRHTHAHDMAQLRNLEHPQRQTPNRAARRACPVVCSPKPASPHHLERRERLRGELLRGRANATRLKTAKTSHPPPTFQQTNPPAIPRPPFPDNPPSRHSRAGGNPCPSPTPKPRPFVTIPPTVIPAQAGIHAPVHRRRGFPPARE